MSNDKLKQAKDRIEKALAANGPYSHNIISMALGDVFNNLGQQAANDLIDEYELEDLGWEKKHE